MQLKMGEEEEVDFVNEKVDVKLLWKNVESYFRSADDLKDIQAVVVWDVIGKVDFGFRSCKPVLFESFFCYFLENRRQTLCV